MSKRIKGITIQLDGETKGLDKALADVNKRSRDLTTELRQVDRLLKFNPGNTELIAQKQKLLADQVENTRERLNRLKNAQEQVTEAFKRGEISEEAYRNFQREIIETESKLKHFESQLNSTKTKLEQFGDSVEKAGEKMKNAGDKMTSVGKDLSMKVTAPIVGLGTLATKTAVDFESSFAGVRKTVDTTEEGFKRLEKGIRDMAKELPASANEIAGVAEMAGQLGIAEENILSFTRTIIDLGEATNLSAEQGATELARFANIVNMSQSDFDRLGSSLVGLGNTMATTESEIMSMSLRLAAQGSQIGMTEAQILALAGAMSSLGIQSEMGGTAMTTILKKIQTAVGEGGEALQGFAQVANMSSEEFKKAFETDAVSALDAFVKGLAQSSEEGANLTTILGELGIKGVYESDVLLRLAGASDLLSEAVATSTNAWEENTALSDEAAERYKTTESQLKILKNTLVDLGIDIGNIIIPFLLNLIEMVKPLVEWFGNLDEITQMIIVTIAGLAAAIGPVIFVLGTLISSIGSIMTVIGPLITSLGGAGGAFTALTGPIGIAVAAVATIVTALIVAYNKIDWFREGVNEIWEKIKEYTSIAFEFIKETISTIISNAVDFAKDVLDKFKAFWDENGKAIMAIVKFHFEQIKSTIEMVMGIIKGIFEVVWPIISNTVKVAWEAIKLVVNTALDIILGAIQTAMKLLQGDWKGAWETIKKTAESIWKNVEGFFKNINLYQIGKDIIQGLINGIGSMAQAVWDKAKSIADGIGNAIKRTLGIASPSKITTEMGYWTGKGLEVGMEKTLTSISRTANRLAEAATPQIDRQNIAISTNGAGDTGDAFNFERMFEGANFIVRSDSDIKAIAREIAQITIARRRAGGFR